MSEERVYVNFKNPIMVEAEGREWTWLRDAYVKGRDEEEAKDFLMILKGLRYFYGYKYVRLSSTPQGTHYKGLEDKLRQIRRIIRGLDE